MTNFELFCIAFFGANHIVLSLVIMETAKRKQLKMIGLSFVPIGNLWIVGKIIEAFKIGNKHFHRAEMRLTTSSLVLLVTIKIPYLGAIICVAYMILVFHCAISFSKVLIDQR